MTRLESGALAPNLEPDRSGRCGGQRAAPCADCRITSWRWSWNRACRCSGSIRCCSSRCCSICWTMPPNMPRPAPASPCGRGAKAARVRVQVLDEGPGLPEEDRERIFDKFYRVRAADKKRAGTGLGLAIARGFMEAMGGTITAANRSDHSWRDLHLDASGAMNPLRVLIVDDEPPIRRFLRTALSAQDYRVEEAGDGEAALDFLKRNPVDLVVLDLGLPGMDGLEVVRRLRAQGAAMPGHHSVQPRRRSRQGRGAGSGRRRLCLQAFRGGGIVGPHPRRPAPPAAAGRREAAVQKRRPLPWIWCAAS